jgi:hypothetical protein
MSGLLVPLHVDGGGGELGSLLLVPAGILVGTVLALAATGKPTGPESDAEAESPLPSSELIVDRGRLLSRGSDRRRTRA